MFAIKVVLPGEVVPPIFQPVLLQNLLRTLPPAGQDGQPRQHRPQSVLLTDVISTWYRNIANLAMRRKPPPKALHSHQIFKNEMRSSWKWTPHLCRSFPLRTETVCLHPWDSQRTSSQWGFHRALFLLPLLLCRKQRTFYDHWSFDSTLVKCLILKVSLCLKIHVHKLSKSEMDLQCGKSLVCRGCPCKARLRFYLSNAALVGMLRAKPLTPVCWKYGMQKMLSAMTATESDGLMKKPCVPRIMLRSCEAQTHTGLFHHPGLSVCTHATV